jgi:uncharacterized protein
MSGKGIERVTLGKTGLVVTRLGWGGIPIQRVDEAEGVSVIRAVIEMGVNLLDTARGYTNSEHRVGLALQQVKKPVVLSTKSPVKTEKIYDEVHASLKALQVGRVDIYHLHNVSTFDDYEKVMADGGAYRGLKRAQAEGLIGHIGLTSHSLPVLERAIEEARIDVAMACYSFLEPDAAKKVFPLAKAKGIGMLAMKAFSGGVIEEAGPALRFVLRTDRIVPIPGSETLERARENWRVFVEGGSLTEKDQAYIEATRAEFSQRFCRRCDYCQPCSQGISIQFALGLKTLIKRFGSMAEELTWMTEGLAKARTCSECGQCLPRCPYQLPIPQLIRENLEWYDSLKRP